MSLREKIFTYRWLIFFVLGSIMLLFLLFGIVSLFNQKPTPSQETPSPSTTVVFPTSPEKQTQTFSPLQKTLPGKTTVKEVEQLAGILKKETIAGNQTAYSLSSPIDLRPNEIRTQNNVVILERQLTPEEPTTVGYATISEFIQNYGQPEKIVKGSKFYGWNIATYIYAQKGLAIIGNPDTDEVYELNVFQPTTVETYTKQFGEDLDPNATPREENGTEDEP